MKEYKISKQKTNKNILRILFVVLAGIAVSVSMYFVVQQRIAEQIQEKKIMAYAYYDKIGEFGDYGASGLALVGKVKTIDGKSRWYYGFINERYEECIPCIYQRIEPFVGEQTIVEIEGKYALINRKGEIENLSKYIDIEDFREFKWGALARAQTKAGYCLIMRDGSKATYYDYDGMGNLLYPHEHQHKCLLEVSREGKWGCIDLNDHFSEGWFLDEEITCRYDYLDFYTPDYGYIDAYEDGMWGRLDFYGAIIVPFVYDSQWELPRK